MLIPRIITQGDIAAMAGVARENTSRILSEWERKKLGDQIISVPEARQ